MYKYYKKYVPYLFLIPAGVILVLFFFIPFFETIVLSFFDYNSNIYHPAFVSLENYLVLLKSPIFYKVLLNTFIYLLVAVPFLVIFPLILAIMLNQKIRGLTLYKILIYLPVIVSIVVAAIAFKWLYAQQGILNYFMELFHLPAIGWLTDPNFALYSVILVTVWK
ncbi:TPA: sugar ABC transporter permease, partial [Candidatus Spyradomonas excrementavium]|nr:sugar ABC transporter permease [Candidatus Spyradomonas excrementavium]